MEGGDGWPLSSPWFYYYYFKIFIHLLCLNETKTGLSCSTQGYSILVVAYGIFTCSKQDLVPWPGMEPAPYSQPNPRYTRTHTHTHPPTHTQLWQFKTHTHRNCDDWKRLQDINKWLREGWRRNHPLTRVHHTVKTKNPVALESSCRDCWESHTSSQHRIWRFPCKCFFQPHFFFLSSPNGNLLQIKWCLSFWLWTLKGVQGIFFFFFPLCLHSCQSLGLISLSFIVVFLHSASPPPDRLNDCNHHISGQSGRQPPPQRGVRRFLRAGVSFVFSGRLQFCLLALSEWRES